MKSQLTLLALFSLTLSLASANCLGPCPDAENLVWGLDASCTVFRNRCYFMQANCHRKPPLTEVTREECQRKCPDACPASFAPVSGTYRGVSRRFDNACLMNAHNCNTGESYI